MVHDAFYNLNRWKTVRVQAKRRDGYRCTQCGAVGVPLDVDHLEPLRQRPDLAFDLSNLRTVCRGCHNRKRGRRKQSARAAALRRNSRRW